MDPCIWVSKNRTTSPNIHTVAMWGYECNPEDQPEVINDREKWRETVRDIRASSTTWWWWHSLQLSRNPFLVFVNYCYAHVSLLCFPLVMLSASHWLLAQARFCGRTHLPPSPNSTTSTGQGDIPISSTGCTCFNIQCIHNTCGHSDISAITLLILSLSGCSCLNIHWYTAPVDMMTFQWSRRSYQSICQQHPPYSHPHVMLIYYTNELWSI